MNRPKRSRRAPFAFLFLPKLAPLGFVLLTALFLADAILSGGAYLLRDILTFHHPWQVSVADAVRAGRLPLWNHASGCGMPLLANLQSGVFYPPHFLGWFLPFDQALTAEMGFHLTAAAWLMSGFLRRTGVGVGGAFLGGLGFAYGTWTLAYLEFPMKLGSAVWLPLLWSGVWDAMRLGLRRGVAWAAIAIALSIFAGYPQLVFYSIASASLLALLLVPIVLTAPRASAGQKLTRLVALPTAAVLAALVAGVQILPSREMLSLSSKVAAYPAEVALSRSLPPQGLFGVLDPFFLGFPGLDRYWGGELAEFPYGAFYAGVLAIPLAGVAAVAAFGNVRELFDVSGRRRKRLDQKQKELADAKASMNRALFGSSGIAAPGPGNGGTRAAFSPGVAFAHFAFLAGGLVLGALLALGRHVPVSAWLLEVLPGYAHMRWPSTAGILVAAHLAALAGLGFDAALRGGAVSRRAAYWIVLMGTLALVFALGARGPLAAMVRDVQTAGMPEFQVPAYEAAHGEWLGSALLRAALLFTAGAAALLLGRRGHLVAWIWIAIVAVDLFAASRAIDMPVARGFYDQVPASTAAMREELAGRRIFTPRTTDQLGNFLAGCRNPVAFDWAQRMMLCNVNVPAGIAQAQGCDPLAPRRHEAFVQAFDSPTLSWELKERIFDLWNAGLLLQADGVLPVDVPTLSSSEGGFVTSRHEPRLGRATLVGGWETVGSGEEALARLFSPEHDPLHRTILEASPGADPPREMERTATGPGEVLPVEAAHGTIRVAWQMGRGGMLRVLETWAPGWRARVNGRAAPVHRADFLFLAVPVPEGPCEVVLEYRPASVRYGAIATAAGLVALFICFGAGRAAAPTPAPPAPRRKPA